MARWSPAWRASATSTDADEAYASADIVHAEELSFWFAADAARRKPRHGYRLVQTVWETLPFLRAFRNRHARRYRDEVLARDRPISPGDRAGPRGAAAGGRGGGSDPRLPTGNRPRALRRALRDATRRARGAVAGPPGLGEGAPGCAAGGRAARPPGPAPAGAHRRAGSGGRASARVRRTTSASPTASRSAR